MLSNVFHHPVYGARIPAQQYVLFNEGKTARGGAVQLKAQTFRITQENRSFFFQAASRGVECTGTPKRLTDGGVRHGAMCFYAGYDGPITRGGSGTNTALIKFERSNSGQLVAKDLTVTSSLPWRGGALGSALGMFPIRNGKYDSLHMMDGAWTDYNRDGLPDLIAVGQHSRVIVATAVRDTRRRDHLRFHISYMPGTGMGQTSEYLRAYATSKLNGAYQKCVYLTGEAPNVYDHLQCFHHGRWKRYNIPGSVSSHMNQVSIAQMVTGNATLGIRTNIPNKGVRQYRFLNIGNVKG
ncbi:MAG: hypothetical protein AAF202_12945, partial [Pseudomonadota bacterium]